MSKIILNRDFFASARGIMEMLKFEFWQNYRFDSQMLTSVLNIEHIWFSYYQSLYGEILYESFFFFRENELLKHQLRKYVNAVQMLRTEGAQKEGMFITFV